MSCEAADVQLVDHRLCEGAVQRTVAFPVVTANVGNDALHGDRRIVSRPACRAAVIGARYRHRAAVWVEEHLRSIEAEPVPGSPGAVRAVRVDLPGAQRRDVRVPVVVSAVALRIERDHARGRRIVRIVEQQEVERRRVCRIHAEVHASSQQGGSERVRATGLRNRGVLSHRRCDAVRLSLFQPLQPTGPEKTRAQSDTARGPLGDLDEPALSHDASSRPRVCASRTRRSMFPAQAGATVPEFLPSRMRIVPSFRSILRIAVARAAGLDAWVALTSNASACATRLAISELVFASISPLRHTSAAPSCRKRHASPSVPAGGAETQPRTGSQTSTVQASSSAHSSSLAHGGAARVDVVVELVDVVVDVGRVVEVVVEPVDGSAAASASMRPKPLASSNPWGPMSTAPRVRAACTSAGVSVGSWSRSSAAIPAECGAAADVPKNAQKGGQAGKPPAFEIVTPSNATRSGLARVSGLGKSMRAGPCELNASTSSRPGSRTSTAPTVTTDGSAACPKMLPAAVPCSIATAPRQNSSSRRGAPAKRWTRMLASWLLSVWFTTVTASIGSWAPSWGSMLCATTFKSASRRTRS